MTAVTPAITKFSSTTKVSKVQPISTSTGDLSVISVEDDWHQILVEMDRTTCIGNLFVQNRGLRLGQPYVGWNIRSFHCFHLA
jgi:hypothetical protein